LLWGFFADVARASGFFVACDRIIYNSTTGALFYDSNGNVAGGAIKFATLTGHPVVSNADFLII
jgi:serralysin